MIEHIDEEFQTLKDLFHKLATSIVEAELDKGKPDEGGTPDIYRENLRRAALDPRNTNES